MSAYEGSKPLRRRVFPVPSMLISVLPKVQQPLAPAHNKSMQVSGRPLQLVMLLERMETPKHYPGSTVTHSPSKLEQLVSDSNKEQTLLCVSKLGPQSQGESHKSHLQPKSPQHRTGFGQTPPAHSSTSCSSTQLRCCLLTALGCPQGTVRDSKDGVMENKLQAPRDRLIPTSTPVIGC